MPGKTVVYCPTSVPVTDKFTNFAPRISTFEGKRIGLHWNGKPNGNFFLNRLAELLEKKYKGIKLIKFYEVEPQTAHPDRKPKAMHDLMAKNIDLFITMQGD